MVSVFEYPVNRQAKRGGEKSKQEAEGGWTMTVLVTDMSHATKLLNGFCVYVTKYI